MAGGTRLTMQTASIQFVVLLHAAFAGVFFFLFRQSAARFGWLLTVAWLIEGLRAVIQLPDVRALGGGDENWFAVSDVLCFAANWCLLAGCAALTSVRLPRWLGPVYFWSGVPVVLFVHFFFAPVYQAWTGAPSEAVAVAKFHARAASLALVFVPVAATRFAVMGWMLRLWWKSHLPGALIAGLFCIPYAVMALAVPYHFHQGSTPDWNLFVWCIRVLGFSTGLVMLMINLQQMELAKSEARLVAAQALAKIGSWEQDMTTGIATWSAEMLRLYGRDPAAGPMSDAEFLSLIHPEDREAFQREAAQGLRERRSVEHEFRIVQADGTLHWIHARNTPYFNPAGELIRKAGVAQDVTERKRTESRVAVQHAVTKVLAEAQPLGPTMERILELVARGLDADYAGFWTMDRAKRRLRCVQLWQNPRRSMEEFLAETRLVAYPAGVGLPGRLLAEREPVFLNEQEAERSDAYPRRMAAVRAGLMAGGGFPILLRTEIFGVVEFFTARTQAPDGEDRKLFTALGTQIGQFIERQGIEEQYRQSQKMEAVGTLAGGIAHDFNNILTAINGYCELAQMDSPPDSAVAPHLQAVRAGAQRASELVRQIMAFSRQQEPQRRPLRIAEVVGEAMKLLRATIPATIEIKLGFEEPLPTVLADPTSIHQVVVNLCTNASHAMKGKPGRLEVLLTRAEVDEDFAAAHPGLRPGGYVRMTVADTGIGMDAATVARIFEPFFTTKGPGEGTGLGLAVVHGIAQSHDGAVFVYSEPGEGTRFLVYFPEHAGEVIAERIVPATVARGHGEKIIYVDDEAPLTLMGRKILERLGYAVETFENPEAALAVLRTRADSFDLLITDLTMPGLTGLDLVREARRIRPSLPIILTSGYAATLTSDRFRALGVREFLIKPHSLASLGGAVERALTAGTVGS